MKPIGDDHCSTNLIPVHPADSPNRYTFRNVYQNSVSLIPDMNVGGLVIVGIDLELKPAFYQDSRHSQNNLNSLGLQG